MAAWAILCLEENKEESVGREKGRRRMPRRFMFNKKIVRPESVQDGQLRSGPVSWGQGAKGRAG